MSASEEKRTSLFAKRSIVFITGASRGLGRTMAKKFAKRFPVKSAFVFLSRNVTALEELRSELKVEQPHQTVVTKFFDQGNIDQRVFDSLLDIIMMDNKLSISDFEQAVMVHNSASTNDVTKTATYMSDAAHVQNNFDVNLTGMILLNAKFLQTFDLKTTPKFILHMTSMASRKATQTLSLYCMGKAAREVFFTCLSLEDPSIRILQYSPGPCDTEMFRGIRDNTVDRDVKVLFEGFNRNDTIMKPETTIDLLERLMDQNAFENAAFVDYADIK